MTNSMRLRKAINDSGLKLNAIMKALKIKSYATIRDKINDVKTFSVGEMEILCVLLKLSEEQREKIFFELDTEYNSVEEQKGA